MVQNHNDTYKKAIEKYGKDNQLFQLIEEMAELAKAVNKWRRNNYAYDRQRQNMVEELADVEIMLEQLKIIANISQKELMDQKFVKIHRLSERLA